MTYQARCSACGKTSSNVMDFKCPSCGKPLEIQLLSDFEPDTIHRHDRSLWRYRSLFPFVDENEIITLGEGQTPLVELFDRVHVKLESLNPTGSFKDRGSTMLVSAIHRLVKEREGYISEDSSGNAGASVAAYSARANLRTKIYVPSTVSGPKFDQIRSYGAEVVKVVGTRSEVAEEAQKPASGKFYVGHILHPLFRDGIRTLAYEIAEQSSWESPDFLYLPVSAGTLLLGVISGFRHLQGSRILKSLPKIVACQTRQVSPLYHRFKNLEYTPPERVTSIADALVSVNPPLLDLMVKNLKEVQGDAVLVEEEEIFAAFRELAGKGFFVEPSSAVAYAGYKKHRDKQIPKETNALIVLTGTGLKTTLR